MQLRVVAGLLVGALFVVCSCGSEEGSGRVDGARARELVEAGATLLDVRTTTEYDLRHVEGAVNIPVGTLAERMAEVPKDKPVVVYCASGVRSAQAAGMLRHEGYTVHDLGRMDAWPSD